MTDATLQTKPEDINLAEMSDDEINEFDPSQLGEPSQLEELDEQDVKTREEDGTTSAELETRTETTDDDTDGADALDTSEIGDKDADSASAEAGTDDQVTEQQETVLASDQEVSQAATASDDSADSTSEVDYKEEFAKLTAPFKAAKREIKVDNIDDARRLMQMGFDYSRKMEAMKPYQRVLKTLQKNDLLDIGRLNFLIDLDKKNPEAIKKFLKDSEIDPMDLNLEDDTKPYTPNDHMVGVQEVALDEVLDEIRETETFDRTAQVISKDWDTASRQVLFEDPSIIRTLNDHMQAGIFDQIAGVMEKERILGRLTGLSDLEAYKQVGDAIHAQNGFNQPNTGRQSSSNGITHQPSQSSGSESAADKAKADELKNRRLAASPPKGAANAGKVKVDLSKLSDDEIENLDFASL